jgi:hypothetical protein
MHTKTIYYLTEKSKEVLRLTYGHGCCPGGALPAGLRFTHVSVLWFVGALPLQGPSDTCPPLFVQVSWGVILAEALPARSNGLSASISVVAITVNTSVVFVFIIFILHFIVFISMLFFGILF